MKVTDQQDIASKMKGMMLLMARQGLPLLFLLLMQTAFFVLLLLLLLMMLALVLYFSAGRTDPKEEDSMGNKEEIELVDAEENLGPKGLTCLSFS